MRGELMAWEDFGPHRAIFKMAESPEGSWAWFEVIATTTVAATDRCFVLGLFDDEGAVQAALPLVKDVNGGLRSLTAPYTTRFSPMAPDTETARELGFQLGKLVTSSVELEALEENAKSQAFVTGLQQAGIRTATYVHFYNWFDAITDFDGYWASRPSRLKETARRKAAAARKQFRVSFESASSEAELRVALRAYLDVYQSSWKAAEPHPQFISTLVQRLALEGSIRLGTLSFNDRPVAAQIWLLQKGKATIFKLAHREEFKSFSPGTLLTRWMIDRWRSEGAALELDFGRGNDRYKRDWLGQVRRREGLVGASWRSGRGILALLTAVLPTRISARNMRRQEENIAPRREFE